MLIDQTFLVVDPAKQPPNQPSNTLSPPLSDLHTAANKSPSIAAAPSLAAPAVSPMNREERVTQLAKPRHSPQDSSGKIT